MRRLVRGTQGNLLFLILACGFWVGEEGKGRKGGQGARCKVQGFGPSWRAREHRYWILGSWTCRSQHADAGSCVGWDADLALGKFCLADIGRGGGNLRSSDVRAERKIDVGRVR